MIQRRHPSSANTHRDGIDVALVPSEGLPALAAPDVPELFVSNR